MMKMPPNILLLFLFFTLSNHFQLITAAKILDVIPSHVEQEELAGKSRVERQQKNTQQLLQGVGNSIAAGAQNLVKGVEHFVVNILSGINDVNFQNQGIEPIEQTTPDPDEETTINEEEETTPLRTTRLIPTNPTVTTPPPTTTLPKRRRSRPTTPQSEIIQATIAQAQPVLLPGATYILIPGYPHPVPIYQQLPIQSAQQPASAPVKNAQVQESPVEQQLPSFPVQQPVPVQNAQFQQLPIQQPASIQNPQFQQLPIQQPASIQNPQFQQLPIQNAPLPQQPIQLVQEPAQISNVQTQQLPVQSVQQEPALVQNIKTQASPVQQVVASLPVQNVQVQNQPPILVDNSLKTAPSTLAPVKNEGSINWVGNGQFQGPIVVGVPSRRPQISEVNFTPGVTTRKRLPVKYWTQAPLQYSTRRKLFVSNTEKPPVPERVPAVLPLGTIMRPKEPINEKPYKEEPKAPQDIRQRPPYGSFEGPEPRPPYLGQRPQPPPGEGPEEIVGVTEVTEEGGEELVTEEGESETDNNERNSRNKN